MTDQDLDTIERRCAFPSEKDIRELIKEVKRLREALWDAGAIIVEGFYLPYNHPVCEIVRTANTSAEYVDEIVIDEHADESALLAPERGNQRVIAEMYRKDTDALIAENRKLKGALEAFRDSISFADDFGSEGGAWFCATFPDCPNRTHPNARTANELRRLLEEALR